MSQLRTFHQVSRLKLFAKIPCQPLVLENEIALFQSLPKIQEGWATFVIIKCLCHYFCLRISFVIYFMQKTVKRGIWMNSLLNLPVGKSSGEH